MFYLVIFPNLGIRYESISKINGYDL